MQMFYSPEDISRLEKRKRLWIAVLAIVAGGALLTCVGLCLAANTANAPRMERAVIILSGAAGCVCLYMRRFTVGDMRHEIDHARMLLRDHGTEHTGVLTVTAERLRIKNSVTIRLIELEEGGRKTRLKVIETRVKRLALYEGKSVRLLAVNGYIAGVAKL